MKEKVLTAIALITVLGIGLFILTGCGDDNKKDDDNSRILTVNSVEEIEIDENEEKIENEENEE